MDAELSVLVAVGAKVLVQEMVGDEWAGVRDRVVALLSRGRGGGVVHRELEELRGDLVDARADGDEAAVADVRAVWRNLIRRALRADPEVATELRAVLDELAPGAVERGAEKEGQGVVHNVISGGVQYGKIVQVHSLGSVTLGEESR